MINRTGGGAFPTREQELLLREALLQGEPALQAWQNWKAHVNLEQEWDAGSYRLLPLVYHNLRALGVDDPLMSKLRGIYHREWYKNQMLFHTIAEVLHRFHAAGIETMILTIGFPRYLQRAQAMDTWQLLTWAISRTIVRIGKAVRGMDQGLG